jgi:hypothetical protein
VEYSDDAGDAHGLDPTSTLNQPAYDIVRVRGAPASHVEKGRRGYATSLTIAGAARDDAFYVSYGEFHSDVAGESCQLYHVLTPGRTAFANAICGTIAAGTRRLVGSLRGSQVTATRTSAGTVLVATFDDAALPRLVEQGSRLLWKLSAFTCVEQAGALGCGPDTFDSARSRLYYRL